MSRCRSGLAPVSVVALLAVALACTDTAGVSDRGAVQVTMQQTDGAALVQLVDGMSSSTVEAANMPLDRDNVLSLTVVVTAIEFLPVFEGDSTEDGGGWISLELSEPVELDLLALPTEGESPLVIAAGNVEPGDYRNVRLLIGDATIVFDQPFSIGLAEFDGEHPVTVPSGAQTGLKTDIAFTVEADGDGNPQDLNLLFDPGITFLNAIATGNGTVILTPVLRNTGQ